MIRATRTLSILVGLSANLIPLYGGLYWQWDSFQLLMLYWMETVIMAFWTILGITASPSTSSGPITVGGRVKPATHKLLCGYFADVCWTSAARIVLICCGATGAAQDCPIRIAATAVGSKRAGPCARP
jgi:hypothetical protein